MRPWGRRRTVRPSSKVMTRPCQKRGGAQAGDLAARQRQGLSQKRFGNPLAGVAVSGGRVRNQVAGELLVEAVAAASAGIAQGRFQTVVGVQALKERTAFLGAAPPVVAGPQRVAGPGLQTLPSPRLPGLCPRGQASQLPAGLHPKGQAAVPVRAPSHGAGTPTGLGELPPHRTTALSDGPPPPPRLAGQASGANRPGGEG